ncbi:hypothetical protein [Sulfitobacter sp. S190]|uniref:hypothetical protein n=1 Tax=Sulfitobacter sp. S190 TaxID=2867022 RepID=UPI0021A68330|nr:hypothetical protein [Sulfitobacter sp. S190]UWR21519.1 hypothetical protein K3756_12520 [Sulfitobacter sp. S190]
MEILLHVGAHRTGTTSFQKYLRCNGDRLRGDGTVVWAPPQTRKNLFAGLFPAPRMQNGRSLQRRATGRIRMNASLARKSGAERLVVTEENIIGAPRNCLRTGAVYAGVGERAARLNAAFDGNITRVTLSIRSLELWWASIAAFSVARGHALPPPLHWEAIACNPRSWRDMITDLACALPDTEIRVLPFEQYAGRADAALMRLTDRAAPANHAKTWHNRSPDAGMLRSYLIDMGHDPDTLPDHLEATETRWQPFSQSQIAMLRERYADDIMWLAAGADGLATLTEDRLGTRVGTSPPVEAMTKGHIHDRHPQGRQGQLAQPG